MIMHSSYCKLLYVDNNVSTKEKKFGDFPECLYLNTCKGFSLHCRRTLLVHGDHTSSKALHSSLERARSPSAYFIEHGGHQLTLKDRRAIPHGRKSRLINNVGVGSFSVESVDADNGNVLFFQLQLESKFQLMLKEENVTIVID